MRGQEYDRVEGGESEGGEQDGEGEREGLTHQHSLANEGLLKFYRGHHDDLSSEITLQDRKSTRLNSSHVRTSRMPSSA